MDLGIGRPVIQVEETQYRGAVSENLAQRLGKGVNAANLMYDEMRWNINGFNRVETAGGTNMTGVKINFPNTPIVGADMPRPAFRDTEIIGMSFTVAAPGSTNGEFFEFDVRNYTAPNEFHTIFSTMPRYTLHASDFGSNMCWVYSFLTNSHIYAPTSTVAPVLDPTYSQISAGNWLVLVIANLPKQCRNFSFSLFHRPRA